MLTALAGTDMPPGSSKSEEPMMAGTPPAAAGTISCRAAYAVPRRASKGVSTAASRATAGPIHSVKQFVIKEGLNPLTESCVPSKQKESGSPFLAQIFIQNVLVKIAIEDNEFLDGIDHQTDCCTLPCFAQSHSMFKHIVLTVIHALLFPVTRSEKIKHVCTSNSNNSNIYIKKITANSITIYRYNWLHPHKTRMHKPRNNITRQQEQIPKKS
jgi:hypothetical protein